MNHVIRKPLVTSSGKMRKMQKQVSLVIWKKIKKCYIIKALHVTKNNFDDFVRGKKSSPILMTPSQKVIQKNQILNVMGKYDLNRYTLYFCFYNCMK